MDKRWILLVLVLLLTVPSIVSAANVTITGNVTIVDVPDTFVGNVSHPHATPPYGTFGAQLTFTNNSANCYANPSTTTWGATSQDASFSLDVNQSACDYTVELIINDAIAINSTASKEYNSTIVIRGFNATDNNTMNFQIIPSTRYNLTNATGEYRLVGAFAVNYTNATVTNATFTYARRGIIPSYVLVCNDWSFGNLWAFGGYGCNDINPTNQLSSSTINGTWISITLSSFSNGIMIGEDTPDIKPIVETSYGVVDALTNVSVIKWGARQPKYYAMVPIMKWNETASAPYVAKSGFADAQYYDKPIFENPEVMELVALNLTVNLNFTGTGTTNLTYGPRFDNVNFKNESNLIPAWYMTFVESFMGANVTRTMLMPSFSPEGSSIYYIYNGSTCGPYNVRNTTISGSNTHYYQNSTERNSTCSEMVLLEYSATGSSITLINLPYSAGATTLTSLWSLAPPSFSEQTGASLSSPIYVVNQTFKGSFIPGPGEEPPQPGTVSNIEMYVKVNNSLTDFKFTGTDVLIQFLYPKNITAYNSTGGVAFQANMGLNFTLWKLNESDSSWIRVGNETYNQSGVVNSTMVCNNMTDNLPGSPNIGNNITLCFMEFDFNLTSVNNWAPGEAASNVTLNMTAALNVSVLSETSVPSGATGATSTYNATVSTASAGIVDLTDKVPNINASSGVTVNYICIDGNCTTDRYSISSFKVTFEQSGTHSVSVSYSRASAGDGTNGGGGTGGGTGTTGNKTHKKTQYWSKITPGVVTIMKITDPEIGLKQINITVNNTAQKVTITVTKLDGKPASIVHEIVGKVYKYIEINAVNLNETQIDNVKIKFEVNKSWINDNNIDPDTVALNRHRVNAWERLQTRKTGEDNDLVYYEAETPGFSTFAISGEEKVETTTTTTTTIPITTTTPVVVSEMELSPWLIIVVIIIIAGVAGFWFYRKRLVIK